MESGGSNDLSGLFQGDPSPPSQSILQPEAPIAPSEIKRSKSQGAKTQLPSPQIGRIRQKQYL